MRHSWKPIHLIPQHQSKRSLFSQNRYKNDIYYILWSLQQLLAHPVSFAMSTLVHYQLHEHLSSFV